MKTLRLAAVAAAVSLGLCLQADAHMGGSGGASASASAHATAGIGSHGFGFHRMPRPTNRFHRTHFRFGDFRSHELGLFTEGAADFDYAGSDEDDYGPDAGDDIDNLHFRVQEPFGPGDIGRPPVRAEADAPYLSDRMDPWHGYEPQGW